MVALLRDVLHGQRLSGLDLPGENIRAKLGAQAAKQQGAGAAGLLFSWLTLGFRASQLPHQSIALTAVAIYLQSWQPA